MVDGEGLLPAMTGIPALALPCPRFFISHRGYCFLWAFPTPIGFLKLQDWIIVNNVMVKYLFFISLYF